MQPMGVVIAEAMALWESECKEAYELGLFDTSCADFIAQRLRNRATPGHTRDIIQDILEELDDTAASFGENYGLPLYYDTQVDEMQAIVLRNLKKLEVL